MPRCKNWLSIVSWQFIWLATKTLILRRKNPEILPFFSQGRQSHNHNHYFPKTVWHLMSHQNGTWWHIRWRIFAFPCVPLCREGIWCDIQGYPKIEKQGAVRWTPKWSWSWLGRPLFSPLPESLETKFSGQKILWTSRFGLEEFCNSRFFVFLFVCEFCLQLGQTVNGEIVL